MDDFYDDDDDDYQVTCPHCGQLIYEGVDQCPHCRTYLSAADFKKPVPKWVLVIIILTIISLLLPTLFSILG